MDCGFRVTLLPAQPAAGPLCFHIACPVDRPVPTSFTLTANLAGRKAASHDGRRPVTIDVAQHAVRASSPWTCPQVVVASPFPC